MIGFQKEVLMQHRSEEEVRKEYLLDQKERLLAESKKIDEQLTNLNK